MPAISTTYVKITENVCCGTSRNITKLYAIQNANHTQKNNPRTRTASQAPKYAKICKLNISVYFSFSSVFENA